MRTEINEIMGQLRQITQIDYNIEAQTRMHNIMYSILIISGRCYKLQFKITKPLEFERLVSRMINL